jgi:hypothetical protein
LLLAHEAIFFEYLGGEIHLMAQFRSTKIIGLGNEPKHVAAGFRNRAGHVQEHAFVTILKRLFDRGKIGQVATLLAVMRRLQFGRCLVA